MSESVDVFQGDTKTLMDMQLSLQDTRKSMAEMSDRVTQLAPRLAHDIFVKAMGDIADLETAIGHLIRPRKTLSKKEIESFKELPKNIKGRVLPVLRLISEAKPL